MKFGGTSSELIITDIRHFIFLHNT